MTKDTKVKKDPILNQLKRIEGQLGGVIKMYQNDRSCLEVVQQITAVRGSLGRVARELITEEAVNCTQQNKTKELNEVLKEIFRY